ncbi:MAG: SirB2 family protein [Zhongshania sp.]|uniref:SirB2 family protein n=1 Tax=Zhongshania sp. TaxID=1971902 RepID=UPI002613B305|nr:SirB2 family protein [Zhongshania sp.]MDF1691479.1 SirB2 family protein [Zhongshania sp.]
MIEFYPQIKLLHIATVLLSGGVFTFRGLLMVARSAQSNHPALSRLSYINDSILLTTGLLLMKMTHQYPVSHNWLSVKLSMLIIYIVLGVYALRAGRTHSQQIIAFIAALSSYLLIISIARAHHPLGIFATGNLF